MKTIIEDDYLPSNAKTQGGRALVDVAQYHGKQDIVNYLNGNNPSATSQITTPSASNPTITPPTAAVPQTQGRIEFYDSGQPYYEFTNFYKGWPILIGGQQWPTSEHYFQAMKFVGPNAHLQETIRQLQTPREVFDAANTQSGTYKASIRPDWEQVKDTVMRTALRAKFGQSKGLTDLLLGTGNAELVEASPYDSYWGYKSLPDGKPGYNMLGKMLVEIREELRTVAGQ